MIELVTFFAGWMIGASIREKRLRKEIEKKTEEVYGQAAVNHVNRHLMRYDNDFYKAMWIGKKAYLEVMIKTVESGVSIENMKTIFEQQLEYVEQEIAVENTRQLLL